MTADRDAFAEATRRAADALSRATTQVISAGAGMGVDSGLPDFRGNEGFWNAYPPYRRLGMRFQQMGAGSAIPTVRLQGEQLQENGATLDRINPREPEGPPGTISIASGALAAIQAIDALVGTPKR